MDLVSIIVPVYNVGGYLEQCIKSLCAQTYKNIEIIIVNDGSTDDSLFICNKWLSKDKRVKIINQKNQGVSIARNVGVTISNGEWICFVDGDDYISCNMIKKMMRKVIHEELDILMCGYSIDYGGGKIINKKFFDHDTIFTLADLGNLIRMSVGININGHMKDTNIGVPWAKLYRKKYIIDNNLSYVPGLRRMQDTVFTISALNKGPRIAYIDESLYYYCMRNDSAIHKYSPDYYLTAISIFGAVKETVEVSPYINDTKEVLNYKAICLLTETIRLQILHKDNPMTYFKRISTMRELSNAEPWRSSLYSKSKQYLSNKQKLFKALEKMRMYYLVYALFRIESIIKD